MKNNQKTINVRTHNSFNNYQCNQNNRNNTQHEEISKEFEPEDINLVRPGKQQTHKKK